VIKLAISGRTWIDRHMADRSYNQAEPTGVHRRRRDFLDQQVKGGRIGITTARSAVK